MIFILLLMALCCNTLRADLSLDEIARKSDTDKSSLGHNYTKVYEKYFEGRRYEPLKILEIGFYRGGSARMWHEYFPNAQLYFIDVDPYCYQCMAGLSSRVHLYMKNQANKKQLQSFIKEVGGDFDIIIDDGGHTMRQQQMSFIHLYPALKSGGIYVIEDLHTSYALPIDGRYRVDEFKQYRREEKITTVDFLKRLVDDVNYITSKTWIADKSQCPDSIKNKLNLWQSSIEAIHFYPSIAFILKEE